MVRVNQGGFISLGRDLWDCWRGFGLEFQRPAKTSDNASFGASNRQLRASMLLSMADVRHRIGE